MPRELKTWGCDFRCGKTAQNRKRIEKHEQTCFSNPARRACKTCKHDCFTKYVDPSEWDHYCAIDARPGDKNAISDCPVWEPAKSGG
jgi:hypothetical protein